MAADCGGELSDIAPLEPLVIRASQPKTFGLLLVSIAFVISGVWLLPDVPSEGRWAVGLFFGLGSVILAIMLMRPYRLTLDRDGFTLGGGLQRKSMKLSWDQVDHFALFGRKIPNHIGFV